MDNIMHIPPNQRTIYAQLWEQVLQKHLQPEDDYEVVALLESFGWTDSRVQEEFGLLDVFQLAKEIRETNNRTVDVVVNRYKKTRPTWPVLKEYVSQFFRGMVFALPMVISIAAMLILRFSLWSYLYLSTRTATAIAVGTLLSFITVGGFMQALARQGYFYMFQGHYQMMRKMTFRLIVLGVLASLTISTVGIAIDVVFPELPFDMMSIALLYYLVLNAIWLTVAVLYIMRRELWFTLLLVGGIGLVYIAFHVMHVNILVAQLLVMSVIAIVSLMLLRYFFYKIEKETDKEINPPLPRFSVTLYNVAPYFLYGALYFGLLFTDRLMAWSTYSANVPFVIWFRGDYELGLDFALVALTIPMGISEVIVSRLMTKVWSSQKDFASGDYRHMNASFSREYHRNVYRMIGVTVVNAIGVYFTVRWIMAQHFVQVRGQVHFTAVTNEVFIVALAAYSILAIGLLHAVVMFSVSRPELVVRPMITAVVLDFTVGFLLTRWISYPQAVWGLLLACCFFTFATTRNVNSVLRSLDYHMYLLS